MTLHYKPVGDAYRRHLFIDKPHSRSARDRLDAAMSCARALQVIRARLRRVAPAFPPSKIENFVITIEVLVDEMIRLSWGRGGAA